MTWGSDGTTLSAAESVARDPSPESDVRSDWVLYRDSGYGVTVRYPSGWDRAEKTLTPNLDDPREILSLGTYPLRPGGDRCPHHPVNAIEDLGRTDAFISVLERASPHRADDYLPRPTHLTPRLEPRTNRFCVPDPARLDAWMTFSDGDRAFYLLVAVGESASDETRNDPRNSR